MIKLGQKGQDLVSGFEGICTGICEYLSGCTQVLLVPPVKEDGSTIDARWYDRTRINVTDESVIEIPGAVEDPGGPSESTPPGN